MNLQISSKVVLKSSCNVYYSLTPFKQSFQFHLNRAPPSIISEQPGMSQQQLHMHSNQVLVCVIVVHNCQLSKVKGHVCLMSKVICQRSKVNGTPKRSMWIKSHRSYVKGQRSRENHHSTMINHWHCQSPKNGQGKMVL